ncbi:MAG: DUF4349 domain-containing protein [Candidatus Micrarchaeota archaeon]
MKNTALLSIFVLLLAFGCLGPELPQSDYEDDYVGSSYAKGSALSAAPMLSGVSSSGTYVTKEGSITLKISEGMLESKFESVRDELTSEGATFSNIDYNEYSTKKQYTLTMKIIPSKFDSVFDMLKEYGEVKYVSVDLDDVTQQYTDLETRITNKEIELTRIRELYNQSYKISDLLSIEQELTRVETEYELLKQQKSYLDSKIQKSTIYLTMYEDKPATQQLIIPFEGLGNLFFGALATAVAIIVALTGFIIPIAVVVIALWVVYKRFKGKSHTSKTR